MALRSERPSHVKGATPAFYHSRIHQARRHMNASQHEQLQAAVTEAASGQRLDAFLATEFSAYSRTLLKRAVVEGSILVNGKRAKPSHRLSLGELISGTVSAAVVDATVPENIPLDILYEDPHIAAINKPAAMVVHPAKGHWSGTLTSALAYHIGSLSSAGGGHRPGIVHRLDRDTSGVILIAKTDAAHRHLTAQFEARTVKKQYIAICRGIVDRDQDRINEPIGPHPYQREKMAVRRLDSVGKPAKTIYEVVQKFRGFTHVRLLPLTGRTHQLRVHMAHLGNPILADRLYAGHARLTLGELTKSDDPTAVIERQALHARRIQFTHPDSGDTQTIEAPMAEDIVRTLETLNRYRQL